MSSSNPIILGLADEDEKTPPEVELFKEAIYCGDIAMAEEILRSYWPTGLPDHSRSNREIRHAVLQAVEHDRHLLIARLLSHGIPFEMRYALAAVQRKSYLTMEVLLEHGWDINTPLGPMAPAAITKAFGDRRLTEWFLSHGADPNAQCQFGHTPLSAAVTFAPFEIIELLIDHGGCLNQGELLHQAVFRTLPDCTTVLQFLLERGAEINRIKFSDNFFSFRWFESSGLGTALHDAARAGNDEAVRYLLDQGADPLMRDTCGDLPIDFARYYNYEAIIHILELAAATESTAA